MSSLKDDASLILIPSLYKDGRLDTVKPLGNSIVHPDATGNHDGTDGSTLPEGNFTFSRGSNLAATRVDVNGLIEKGRENLILQSNQFDTTWTLTGATSIAGGQVGYGGTNDAWILETSSAAGSKRVQQSVSVSGVKSYSVYAKAGTSDFLVLGGAISAVWFNLSSGVVGANTGGAPTSIESVGNGWYRCTMVEIGATSIFQIYVANIDGSTSTAVGDNIYIQDAQLEQGLVATDYIETGATTAQAGVLENEPRLDYSGGASCPSLLLEPQRTNADPNAEYLANKPIVTNVSVTTNSITSPEGVVNASTITNNTTNGQHQLTDNTFSVTSGTDYTISLFLKYNDAQYIRLQFGGTSFGSTNWQNFDVQNGTKGSSGSGITSADTSIEDYGNGWYRCIVTADATATGSNGAFQIRILEDDNTNHIPSFAGSGLSTYAWGAQFEQGSYPTSYIPTYGTSQTRSIDQADNQSLNPVLGNGNISVMYDFVYDVVGREGSGQIFLLYSGNNSLGIKGTQSTDRRMQLFSYGDFSGTIGFNEDVPYQTRHKVVFRVTGEVVELFYNGVKQSATISGAALGGVYNWSRIKLDPTNAFLAGLNQLLVFPTALTDSECIALTTI
jgi:hypothetical protein